MKKYNTLFVVLFTILLVFLLTWILPVTYFNGELMTIERYQAGITELFNYPVYTFYNFIYVLVYLLAVGGLYGVLNKIPAYCNLMERITKAVKKRQILFLILTVLISSLVVSFTGFTFEMLLFLPFIAGIIFLLGHDKITALMTTLGSIVVGIIASSFSLVVVGTFNGILGTTYMDLLLVKGILLIVGLALLILNIVSHCKKENVDYKEENIFVPNISNSKKTRVWPLAILLISLVVVMIVSSINWEEAFKTTFFVELLASVKEWKILSSWFLFGLASLIIALLIIVNLVKWYRLAHEKKNIKFCDVVSKCSLITLTISVIGILLTLGNIIGVKYRYIILGLCSLYIILTFVKYLVACHNSKKKDVKLFASKLSLIGFIICGLLVVAFVLEFIFGSKFSISKVMLDFANVITLNNIVDKFSIGLLIGGVTAFGGWTYNEFTVLIFILIVILKFVYKIKIEDLFDNLGDGSKKYLYAIIVITLSYTVLIFTVNNPVMLTVIKPLLTMTDGFNNISLSIGTFFSALFNSDLVYYQNAILTLSYVTSYITDASVYPLCELITQSMYGLAMLVAPTSIVLLFGLSTLRVTFWEWFKNIWKLFVELLVVLMITFVIVLLII